MSSSVLGTEQELKTRVGIGILLGLGFVLVAFNTVRAVESDASIYSRAVGLAIPFALALTLFAGAVGVVVYGLRDRAFRIAVWTVLGGIAGMIAVTLNIVVLPLLEPDFTLALYMVTNAAAGGAALGFLIGIYDANQKGLQASLTEKTEEAETLSQRLSVLNRVLRHDARTQSQIIQSYAEKLEAEQGSETPTAAIERIIEANERLMELSEEARQLQVLLAGSDLEPEPTDVVALVRAAGDTVQTANDALTIEYDLPDEQVVLAPPMLRQALEHVLYNAVDHNDAEHPRAEIALDDVASDDATVRLTVTDNGPGIPDHERTRDPGHQEDQFDHSEGVGLWLVTWILEEAGGDVTIEPADEDGMGTAVTLTLATPVE